MSTPKERTIEVVILEIEAYYAGAIFFRNRPLAKSFIAGLKAELKALKAQKT